MPPPPAAGPRLRRRPLPTLPHPAPRAARSGRPQPPGHRAGPGPSPSPFPSCPHPRPQDVRSDGTTASCHAPPLPPPIHRRVSVRQRRRRERGASRGVQGERFASLARAEWTCRPLAVSLSEQHLLAKAIGEARVHRLVRTTGTYQPETQHTGRTMKQTSKKPVPVALI
ncbi:formin-like protein 20 [Mus caroli]|uniref:Formin-like protein 20 n=1 Tax=Mus caroli TaxID=10089 RepID=A0A6P7QX86_MUSCR|nr:formin-like protein 20 [Mus caroli]